MRYCLIGEKLGHSYSKEIHNKLGVEYDLVELRRDEIENFVKNQRYCGFNVTIPYKKDIISYLDELDDSAKISNAVNTVLVKSGKLKGYNTDISGMDYMISRKGVSLEGKNVLILGSGGTSNTAQTLSRLNGAKTVNVVSRNGSINYQNCYDIKDAEIIINTTPVGMYPNVNESLIDLSRFDNLIAVFDCIYNPFKTKLLCQAENLGLTFSDGLSMLVRQAIIAEEIWSEKDFSSITEKVIDKMRFDMANVILYGMPSSGKSTLGLEVSKILNREFIDLDEYITNKVGKSPKELIIERGESAFREIEHECAKEVAKLSSKVVSLGGGTVLNSKSVDALKQNGVLIYVKRDLESLSLDDRPLSLKNGVFKLYEERKTIYESVKDGEIDNNSSVLDGAKEIVKVYEIACNKWC